MKKPIKTIQLSISVLFLLTGCLTTQVGTDYSRRAGAEKTMGHAILFFTGVGDCTIEIFHRGTRIENFKLPVNSYHVVPLRVEGDTYRIKFNFEQKTFSRHFKGSQEFTVTSEVGVVHGLKINTRSAGIISSASYNKEQEKFAGIVAAEILNPRYQVFGWDDLVRRNKLPENLADQDTDADKGLINNSIQQQLDEVLRLYESGLITEEEYNEMRLRILKQL